MAEDPSLAELLAATAAKDEEAFGALYEATSARIFAVVLRIVTRRDWAEEVLQEVYITIWERADAYRPEKGAPMAWLTTIGRNRALDRLRRRRNEVPLEVIEGTESCVDPAPSPLDWSIAGAEARRLKACLDALEARQRDSILMAMVEGYTHSELASRFDCPLGTVKSWIRRGLQRLKVCLER